MKLFGFSVVVIPEASSYSAWCPELDVASQGKSVAKAVENLKEALSLHLECLSSAELVEVRRRQGSRLITTVEVPLPA
jgi:predicted RNase H-like HicB family nuclease